MRLYYIDESEGPRYYVRSALGVDGERWNELFGDIHAWRLELQERYGIPLSRELHACDLLAGRGRLARNGDTNERVTLKQGVEVFLSGLRKLEDAARNIGGIEVINVCLHKPESRRYEQASLDCYGEDDEDHHLLPAPRHGGAGGRDHEGGGAHHERACA